MADYARTAPLWQANDTEAIRTALNLLATVPCLEAINTAMADLAQQHPPGVLSARALLDAVGLIDNQLLSPSPELEQAVQKQSFSGPVFGSSAYTGEAPLQKADVVAYDTALLRQESEKTFANPTSTAGALLVQRRRYSDQLLLLLPALRGWVVVASGGQGCTAMQRG